MKAPLLAAVLTEAPREKPETKEFCPERLITYLSILKRGFGFLKVLHLRMKTMSIKILHKS